MRLAIDCEAQQQAVRRTLRERRTRNGAPECFAARLCVLLKIEKFTPRTIEFASTIAIFFCHFFDVFTLHLWGIKGRSRRKGKVDAPRYRIG